MCILLILENFKSNEKPWNVYVYHIWSLIMEGGVWWNTRVFVFVVSQNGSFPLQSRPQGKNDGPRWWQTVSYTRLVKTFDAMCLKLGSTKLTSRCLSVGCVQNLKAASFKQFCFWFLSSFCPTFLWDFIFWRNSEFIHFEKWALSR